MSTTSLVELLRAQPNLADEIPVLGHIPKLFNLLTVRPKHTLSVLHQLTLSEVNLHLFLFLNSILSNILKCFTVLCRSNRSNRMYLAIKKMYGLSQEFD